jgi:hypothetical protein
LGNIQRYHRVGRVLPFHVLKPRVQFIKRLFAIFGCVAALVLLAVVIIWVVPYYRSKQEVREAISIYQKAGLPVIREEIFHKDVPDHVTPILEEIGKIRDDPKILELLRKGEPYADELTYSKRWFTQTHFKKTNGLRREKKWNCPDEKLSHIQKFCADPRTRKALSLLREAARHDFRNGQNDAEFHGAWLPRDQDNGREYLTYLLIDQSRIARDDPSKSRDIFLTLLLSLKMENLLVQGYTFTHYLERHEHCIDAFNDWMRFDRAYGTPADLIDDFSKCMSPKKEEEIWLKCHDCNRSSGIGCSYRYCEDISKMMEYDRKPQTWRSFMSVKMPYMLRNSFLPIKSNQDHSFFLKQALSTRGVSQNHFKAAVEVDQRFKDRNKNEGPLFLPPCYEIYIESYHELMMWHEILKAGLAINSYADAYGVLPKSLDDLVPSYLPSVPQDHFPIDAPQPLIYEAHGNFFNLKSSFKNISFKGRRTK